jgi:hypothetical protein
VTRRSSKSIYYSLASEDASQAIRFLEGMFGDRTADSLSLVSRRHLAVAE